MSKKINELYNIDDLRSLAESRGNFDRFPRIIEHAFQSRLMRNFNAIEMRIIYVGIAIFAAFGWSDLEFGGENKHIIMSIRFTTAAILFSFASWMPYSRFRNLFPAALGLGVIAVYGTMITNMLLATYPARYFYELSFVIIQVFCMIAMRHHVRVQLVTSLIMLCLYLITRIFFLDVDKAQEISILAAFLFPYSILFWLCLIGMGIYLSYFIESGSRRSFLVNLMLGMESDRLRQLNDQLDNLSRTDPLSGLTNRRAFDDITQTEWLRCIRYEYAVSILVIDLDWFKKLNDSMGHSAGDKAIIKVADILQDFTRRPGDCAARYGGEEFVILLPNCSKDAAIAIAERIRIAVSALGIPHPESKFNCVTSSIGVATTIPATDEDLGLSIDRQFDTLFKRADDALYRAKEQGRNQVVFGEAPSREQSPETGFMRHNTDGLRV